MKYLVSLLLAIALVGVNAYEFDDSAFNEYLFNELQSLNDEGTADTLTHRSRRDTEDAERCYRRANEMNCCNGAKFNPERMEAFRNVKKECLAEVRNDVVGDFFDPFNCEEMNKVKEKLICMSECVAKKFKSIDENGDVKRDLIVEHLRKNNVAEQWKVDAAERMVDKCITEMKERREQRKTEGKTTEGCSRDPIVFQRCLHRELFMGCPADLRVDSPKCNKLRERVEGGNIGFFGKHFLHKYYFEDK